MKIKEKYIEVKKRLDITDKEIAEWAGYKNAESFRKSAGYDRTIKLVVSLFEKVGEIFKF